MVETNEDTVVKFNMKLAEQIKNYIEAHKIDFPSFKNFVEKGARELLQKELKKAEKEGFVTADKLVK